MSTRYPCRLCKTVTSRINAERLCHACDPHAIPFRQPAHSDALTDGEWFNDKGIQRWLPGRGVA